jgi:hypothetical protein
MPCGLVSALLAVLLVSGCGATGDPREREGTWRPSGANTANLRAMVAEPSHLQRGASDPTGRGRQATNAIERLEDDDLKPLPDVRASQVGR